jgi:hypothetical protein
MSKESPLETVRMTDGTIKDFPGKTRCMTDTYEQDGQLYVRLDFRNGETRIFRMRGDMIARFALHGAKQKLTDEMAGVKELDDAILAVEDLVERLDNGEWKMTRASGESLAGTSVLARAMVEFTGKAMTEIKAYLKTKTQAEKMALRNNPRIKPIVDRIEAEKVNKASEGVDTDAMLSELGV